MKRNLEFKILPGHRQYLSMIYIDIPVRFNINKSIHSVSHMTIQEKWLNVMKLYHDFAV